MPATRDALRLTEKLIEQKRQSALVSLDAKKELVALHSKHFPKYHGYGAIIPRHPPGYDHRILATTTHTDYGGAYSGDLSKRTEHFSVAAHARGRAASAGGVGTGGLGASASATTLAPLSASARGGAAPGATAAGAGAGVGATATGSIAGATLRPNSVGSGTLRAPVILRSPLISSGINVDVDPTRPLCKPPPSSLSATAHTAVVSAVTGNAPVNPASLGGAGARAPKPKRAQGAATFGATGERLRIAPTADPKEHTFVQRAWLYDRSVNNHFLADRTDKHAGLAAVPGAGLNIGTGHGFGVPPADRTSFARRSAAWKDPTGIWSG